MNCENKRKICKKLDCELCFKKSFASNPKSKYLIDDINPRFIFKKSGKKYNFKCNECNHIFKINCDNISKNKWCPYCVNRKLCNKNDCKICYEKSFVSHPKSKYLIGDINPRLIFKYSNNKYNFKCNKCNHTFIIRCSSITNGGSWCAYCKNQKLCNDLECKICFEKSLKSYYKSKYLVDNINSRFIFKGSRKKLNFKCNYCNNIFNSMCKYITNGSWCPICKNKTEKKVYEWLIEEYQNYNIIREKMFKSFGKKRFDFFIKELNIIIEIDGNQHFKEVANWNCTPEKSFKNDVSKTDFCLKNNLSIIRINQDDIWKDKINWKNILKSNLKLYEKSILLCFESINKNNYEKIKNHFQN